VAALNFMNVRTTSALMSLLGLRASNKGVPEMCDFSLYSLRSRPAQVGDKLVTHDFGTGTRGFAAVDDLNVAVCLMPGTELAFSSEVAILPSGLLGWERKTTKHRTAIFRQVNKQKPAAHHDALEFPDGRIELLTILCEGQAATVLQLPAQQTIMAERDSQIASRKVTCAKSNRSAWSDRALVGWTGNDKGILDRIGRYQ
jgi:hypothetical protein